MQHNNILVYTVNNYNIVHDVNNNNHLQVHPVGSNVWLRNMDVPEEITPATQPTK